MTYFLRVIGVVKVSLSIVLYTYCHQLFYNSFVTYTHGFPFWSKGCLNPPHSPLAPWYICTLKKSVQTSLLFNFIFFHSLIFSFLFLKTAIPLLMRGRTLVMARISNSSMGMIQNVLTWWMLWIISPFLALP